MAHEAKIELTVDEKGAVRGLRSLGGEAKKTAASMEELGAATKATGAATETFAQRNAAALDAYLRKNSAVTKTVTQNMTVSQDEVKRLMAQIEGLQNMGPKAMKAFNEQIVLFQKQGLSPFAAQQRAIQSTLQLLEKEKAAVGGVNQAYGESRVIMGLMAGSTREMQFGLASVMGKMKGMAALWDAAMPVVMIGAGVAMIVQMGQGVYDLYEKWLDVDGAIEQYNEKASQAAQKQFLQNSGLDQLNADLKTATDRLQRLERVKSEAPGILGYLQAAASGGLSGVTGLLATRSYLTKSMPETMSEVDQTKLRQMAVAHQEKLQEMRSEALVQEARLTGLAKERAKFQAQEAEAAEKERYSRERAAALTEITNRSKNPEEHRPVVPNFGAAERRLADAHAQAQFDAARIQDERSTQDEIRRLDEQAREAALSGVELLEAQRKFADTEWVRQHGESAEAVAAIDRSYYAKEAKLRDQEREQKRKAAEEAEREVTRLEDQAKLGGLTGAARIRQQGANRMNEFKRAPGMGDWQYLRALSAIAGQTEASLNREAQSFADEVTSALDGTVNRTVSGYARIRADAEREIARLQRDYKEKGGRPEDLERGIGGVRQRERSQIVALDRQNADETRRIEMQARITSMRAEQQQTAAIAAEYEARTHRYFEELRKREITQEDYNRRMVAAAETRDAEVAANARREREKLAHEYTAFFRNPLGALQSMGEKAAGEAAAAMTKRLEAHFGGGRSPLSGDFSVTDIWSHLAGKSTSALDRRAERTGTHEQAAGIFSVGAAHITVGTASVMLAGGHTAAGAGYGGGARLLPAVATSTGSGGGAGGSFAGMPLVSDLGQGAELAHAAWGAFHRGAGASAAMDVQNVDLSNLHFDKHGKVVSGAGSGFSGKAAGVLGGSLGLFSAFEGGGGAGGAMSGAMSGMQMGLELGGPIGAGIGAAAGAVLGLFGRGGRDRARMYDLRTVRPRLAQELQAYQTGGSTYLSVYSDLEGMDRDAKIFTNPLGFQGHRYYENVIRPEIKRAEGRLTGEERGGRSHFGMATAMFATGVDRVPHDGLAYLHRDESVFSADRTERATRALEALPSLAAITAGYRMAMSHGPAPAAAAGSYRTLHMNINAIDSKSVAQFFHAHKHHLRAALNASYEENSGGADA